jgi:hypothetical protein
MAGSWLNTALRHDQAMPPVQAMTVQARDVHAPGAGPSQRAKHAGRLILIAPAAELLTSPMVFRLLRRRSGERAGYLLGFVWYGWPGMTGWSGRVGAAVAFGLGLPRRARRGHHRPGRRHRRRQHVTCSPTTSSTSPTS